MQYDYKYSMTGWSQVITGVKFNCFVSHARRPSHPTANL